MPSECYRRQMVSISSSSHNRVVTLDLFVTKYNRQLDKYTLPIQDPAPDPQDWPRILTQRLDSYLKAKLIPQGRLHYRQFQQSEIKRDIQLARGQSNPDPSTNVNYPTSIMARRTVDNISIDIPFSPPEPKIHYSQTPTQTAGERISPTGLRQTSGHNQRNTSISTA